MTEKKPTAAISANVPTVMIIVDENPYMDRTLDAIDIRLNGKEAIRMDRMIIYPMPQVG